MFRNLLNKARSIYDIMAAAFISLDGYSGLKTRGYKPTDYIDLAETIKEFSENDEHQITSLKIKLLKWIDTRISITTVDLYAIILSIDNYYPYKAPDISKSMNNFENKERLNEFIYFNKEAKIVSIFPRLKKTLTELFNYQLKEFEKNIIKNSRTGLRNRRDSLSNSININLFNYDFYEYSSGDYKPILHIMKRSKHIAERIMKKGELTIGFFPLLNINITQILDISFSSNSFKIDGIKPNMVDILYERYCDAMESCRINSVDFAIFPEMLLNDQILERILNDIIRYDEDDMPILTSLGTIWGDSSNNCIVVSSTGEVLFRQPKHTPFTFKNKYTEELSLLDKSVHIIDIEGIGRISTFICLDILNPDLVNISKKLCSDFAFIPAYSKSRAMKTELESMASKYWCTILQCNTCVAFCEDEKPCVTEEQFRCNMEIGFICSPAKKDTLPFIHYEPVIMDNSCCKCLNSCKGRIYKISYKSVLAYQEGHIAQKITKI